MNIEAFQQLSQFEVAKLVQARGCHVCVFPINGTRRWFLLEYPSERDMGAYVKRSWERHMALYQLIFDHGIHTLLNPIFGPDLLQRGVAYQQLIVPGLRWFCENEQMVDFYERYEVRVRVYGDTHLLQGTSFESLLTSFDDIAARTKHYKRHRLFLGICAHDAAETTAKIGYDFYTKNGRLPNRSEIIEAYYGENIDKVDLFIGFDKLKSFDMPLIATGDEDLYFTVAPSPYLNEATFRTILYDHLFARKIDDVSYAQLSQSQIEILTRLYAMNRTHVIGVGRRSQDGHFWYPTPQVKLPSQLELP